MESRRFCCAAGAINVHEFICLSKHHPIRQMNERFCVENIFKEFSRFLIGSILYFVRLLQCLVNTCRRGTIVIIMTSMKKFVTIASTWCWVMRRWMVGIGALQYFIFFTFFYSIFWLNESMWKWWEMVWLMSEFNWRSNDWFFTMSQSMRKWEIYYCMKNKRICSVE